MHILFPGRHHILTDFQFKYLYRITQAGLEEETDVFGKSLDIKSPVTSIIFAVTSANHSNTRRNPLPFYLRAISLEGFSEAINVPTYVYGIDDIGVRDDFASYTIKMIKHESEGRLTLSPDNTLVVCSTPVMKLYQELGFRILPAELENNFSGKMHAEQPWDLVEYVAKSEGEWHKDKYLISKIHPSSYKVWKKYQIGEKVKTLFSDKIIGDDGDITSTRDYNTYVRQMDEIADMKYNDTSKFIKPGRIGDIGCAVGSWIKLACSDERLRESDFYGIEVSRHLYDICQQRKYNGDFKNPFVFFAQKNAVTGLVFDKESMNTIFTSSLTHEIESYGSREDLIRFIKNRYEELVPGGVWINRDVVGPEDGDRLIYLRLNNKDGRNDDYEKDLEDRSELSQYLSGLSTFGRFLRFARDFRKKQNYILKYKIIQSEELFIELSLRDACEFATKKDYLDNWKSEMNETFAFWSYTQWKHHVEDVGFEVSEESLAFTNQWIVENRFRGKLEFFELKGNEYKPIEFPVTNMFLVAEKKV
ncbi:MAG: transferase [Cytophagaceae bacterium]